MKASSEFIESIQTNLNAALEERETSIEQVREDYKAGRFPRADSVKDLDVRFRFDLYWFADGYARRNGTALGDQARLEGLADSHLHTAVFRAIPSIDG